MNKEPNNLICMDGSFPEPFAHGDAKPNSAILRPYNKFLKDGSKIGRLAYVFYQEGASYPSRILGSFLYSEAKRLVFFPGLNIRKYLYTTQKNKQHLIGQDIDHITLEVAKNNWHFTTLTSKHKDTFNTRKISRNIYYWFGLSVRSQDDLEVIPATFNFTCPASDSDSQRRLNELIKSRDKTKFPLIQMTAKKSTDYFIHFDFLVDTRILSRFRSSKPLQYSEPPCRPPVLTESTQVPKVIPIKQCRITIPTFSGSIIINVSFSKGHLTHEAYISSLS